MLPTAQQSCLCPSSLDDDDELHCYLSSRICRTQLLSSADTTGLDPAWQYNPGLAGFVSFGSAALADSKHATASPSDSSGPPDKPKHRYFITPNDESAAPPGSEREAERLGFVEWYESHLIEHPDDEHQWMAFALEHLRHGQGSLPTSKQPYPGIATWNDSK